MPSRPSDLSLAEYACLAIVGEGAEHGWAVWSLLAPGGDVGRVWSLSRPLTYRALDQLVERRLLSRQGTAGGRGRARSLVKITAAGRRTLRRWFDAPVAHLRDVRTELVLKLVLRERAGLAATPLLVAQRQAFAEVIDALTRPGEETTVVDRWRTEHARAVRRFLDGELHPELRRGPGVPPTTMRLSARNQLAGTVETIAHGDVLTSVGVLLPDGQRIAAVVTIGAVADLDVAVGDDVLVVVKSTEVMLAKP